MTKPTFTTIISVDDLYHHFDDPDWAIIDCRFDLTNPGWGHENYHQSHIPGSVYAHIDQDLSGPITPQSGRHPLPDIQQIVERLSSWGVGNQSQVVVYDTLGGAYAARLWWLMRMLGHQAVAVLDGSFKAWLETQYPVTSGIEAHTPALFTPDPQTHMVADTSEVNRIRTDPAYCLIDARTPERFRGEHEPIDSAAGHIPGAVNRFHGENLAPDGKFRSPGQLKEQFRSLIGNTPPERVIVYCGSGVTSCHHILAMELAGLSGSRLYVGSWSEWIRDPDRPIA